MGDLLGANMFIFCFQHSLIEITIFERAQQLKNFLKYCKKKSTSRLL